MTPRPLDRRRDLAAVAALVGRTRAAGGLSHPGGLQWWMRELAGDRGDFEAFVWDDGREIAGFALVDATFVVTERLGHGPTQVEQLEWLEHRMRDAARDSLHVHVAEGDPDRELLERRGYAASGSELELMSDVDVDAAHPGLPIGFTFASLDDVSDDAYIDGHRAAWSDRRPSPYRRDLHEAVRRMPQFRSDLVTIVLAPDGTVASYCIGWMDERSRTLEIEPLGTHHGYRRLGLAHAVVREVQRRAWANGAQHVLVWNDPASNAPAYRLYTGAGMTARRTLIELVKPL